jgi:ribosomal protein L11 methyltransferase PrmA
VAAIAAAMAGAAAVTAYDIDPVAAVAIRMNAAANGVTVLAVCADVLGQDNLPASGTDLVLVADAFYERDLAGKVTKLAERGHARGAAVLVGDFGRAYLPRDRLMQLASYDVPGQLMLEGSDIKHTAIWALSPRPAATASAEPEHRQLPQIHTPGPATSGPRSLQPQNDTHPAGVLALADPAVPPLDRAEQG